MSDASSRRDFLKRNLVGGAVLASGVPLRAARADDKPLKVGFLISYSGPSAVNGPEADAAMQVFFDEHGDTVAGRKIVMVKRDSTGPSPEVNRRVAQDLIVNEKVELLAGLDYTPSALALASLTTQARMPLLMVNAATSGILLKAPYMVRFGLTVSQMCGPFAAWLPSEGVKSLFSVFSDYGPGLEAGAVFRRDFTAAGGEIVGEIRVPVSSPDFSGYVQRIKDARPQAVFIFLPAGEQPIAFLNAAQSAGLTESGIKIYATGDLCNETAIDAIGDSILGITSTYIYSDTHDSALNKSFTKRFHDVTGGKLRPTFIAAITYDVMGAILALVKAQGGNIDPDKTIDFLKTYKAESPRGPIEIDPETRDTIANVYLRRTERQGDMFVNTEFKTFPMVKSSPTPVT